MRKSFARTLHEMMKTDDRIFFITCDLGFKLFDEIKKDFPEGIDILINNAGLLIKKPFEELSAANFQQSFQVNFFGVVELIQYLTSRLEINGAHVVNISSMGAYQGSSLLMSQSY